VQRTKWALGFAMLVFGFLITTQLRVTEQLHTDPAGMRADELAKELKTTQDKLKAAEKDKAQLKADLDKLANTQSGVVPVPKRDVGLELLAGIAEAKGPGLLVTVVESPDLANKTRVRDEDLWMVVHELLAAGAEGVSVNGERVTSVTGIRNVGNRIMINNSMTTSPYQVKAIGEPTVLETALSLKQGVVDTLRRWGLRVTIVRSEAIELPSFGSVPEFRYMKAK
jgi:uncharacterized protein YlxW (UPF0749 family)